MKEFNEMMKKEYSTPQMEVMSLDVQEALLLQCSDCGGDVEVVPGEN